MTVPSYTEDLTDVSLADESAGWVEMTGTDQDGEAYNANGGPAYEDNEYPYIQGLYAITQDTTKSTSVGSLAYSSGGITIPTDGALFLWHNYSSPFAMGTYTQGGYRIIMGSGLADFDVWYVGGSDKDNNPYGGWVNHVVNDTVARDNWAGTSTSIDYVGSAISVISGPSKGEPHQCDAIRYGRGSSIFEFGEAANYCTFAGFAALNDAQAARWGLIQKTSGGYLWKGRMQLGSVTNPVDFRDADTIVFVQWTPKVTINFNTIDIINASSNIEMTGIQFICLDPDGTASKGRWLATDDAPTVLNACVWNDWYTFVFNSNHTITGGALNRCDQATQAGATITGFAFNKSISAVSLVSDDLDLVTECDFISDGSNHAIDLGTISTNTSFTWENYITDYASADGSTGNEVILVSVDSGITLTLNISAGYDSPTVYNTGLGTVTKVSSVSLIISGLPANTEVTIVKVSDRSELYHIENSIGDVTYAYGATEVGLTVDILIHHIDYDPNIGNYYDYILPSSDTPILVNLISDETYYNP